MILALDKPTVREPALPKGSKACKKKKGSKDDDNKKKVVGKT